MRDVVLEMILSWKKKKYFFLEVKTEAMCRVYVVVLKVFLFKSVPEWM